MTSLRECVSCQEVNTASSFLLPCLHAACSQCIGDFVQDAQTKKRKRPSCCECGEPFDQKKLATVPNKPPSSLTCSFDCDEQAAVYCSECKKHICKAHSEGHRVSNKTKGHVVQLIAEAPCCHEHPTETAVGFCTHCKLLLCGNCIVNRHNQAPHLSISLDKVTNFVKSNVAQLLESIPAINKEIETHTKMRTKLEKERTEFETRIDDIRSQEKVETLQIEDLEHTKALLLTAQTQSNALASTDTTLPHGTVLRLQSIVAERVANLQSGLGLISSLISSVPSAFFNRVCTERKQFYDCYHCLKQFEIGLAVSNNRKTIRKKASDFGEWGYAISDDGCSSGVRSWHITINSIHQNYDIMFGIWNSSDNPSSNNSFTESNTWVVHCSFEGDAKIKGGSEFTSDTTSPVQTGNVILLIVDADKRRLAVKNITRGSVRNIFELPPPNPAYYPHLLLYGRNDSVTIE